ncbi:MAG: LysE family translocator [Rhodospirillales bacterium]|nr:LysE family translocator [Rhodospirillales bacterium]
MVLRACAAGGKRAARYAAVGICLGLLLWGAAVAVGLGAVLKTSPKAYMVVKYAGAIYLFWVGFKLIRHPRLVLEESQMSLSRNAGMLAFRRGLVTNLLNPKIGVFYVTFLPQFIPAHANVAADTLVLAMLHVVLTMIWFAVLIMAAVPLSTALRQPRTLSLLDRVAGGVFILFGLRLALSRA